MVITRWKDSNILQVVGTTITEVVAKVTRRKGRYFITVKLLKEIITYNQLMGGLNLYNSTCLWGQGSQM